MAETKLEGRQQIQEEELSLNPSNLCYGQCEHQLRQGFCVKPMLAFRSHK